ncbi:MAG: hypothetical protein U0Q22_03855 [Acidimicrobiales bacterium]
MSGDRFAVVGLARVRSPWFGAVAGWANSSQLPIDFHKCVSAADVHRHLESGLAIDALLVDGDAPGVDRDLLQAVRRHGSAVLVVVDHDDATDWPERGATSTLPRPVEAEALLSALRSAVGPGAGTGRRTSTSPPDGTSGVEVPDADDARWRGRLVAVTGPPGCGRSTIAIALAQGLGAIAGNEGAVVLADLAARADLAMYHDVGDVMPGVQELVDTHRRSAPTRSEVRSMVWDIEQRGYSLLLGLRRPRHWTELREPGVTSALDALRAAFRHVVADIDAELDGRAETGSTDIADRNAAARVTTSEADLVLVCGDATMRGVHALARAERDLIDAGLDATRLLLVVNRAPRSPRVRAEITRTLAALTDDDRSTGAVAMGPVFLPDRAQVEVAHRVAGPLPSALTDPLVTTVTAMLGHLAGRPAGDREQ